MDDVIQILKKQDQWTPTPPPGLSFQIAVLTWMERNGGSVSPWALTRLAVPRLAELVQADQVSAEYWVRERRGLLRRWHEERDHSCSWADLMKRSDSELEEEGKFPHRLTFERDGGLLLLEQTEFWNMVGGPAPYHDSVALLFFSELDIRAQIQNIILDTCKTLGIEEKDAEPEPGAYADKPRRSG